MTAYNLILHEPATRSRPSPNAVIEKKEIYGDDLVRLLDAQNFQARASTGRTRPLAEVSSTDSSRSRCAIATSKGKGDGAPVELDA